MTIPRNAFESKPLKKPFGQERRDQKYATFVGSRYVAIASEPPLSWCDIGEGDIHLLPGGLEHFFEDIFDHTRDRMVAPVDVS
jgi:hypothetical protein